MLTISSASFVVLGGGLYLLLVFGIILFFSGAKRGGDRSHPRHVPDPERARREMQEAIEKHLRKMVEVASILGRQGNHITENGPVRGPHRPVTYLIVNRPSDAWH